MYKILYLILFSFVCSYSNAHYTQKLYDDNISEHFKNIDLDSCTEIICDNEGYPIILQNENATWILPNTMGCINTDILAPQPQQEETEEKYRKRIILNNNQSLVNAIIDYFHGLKRLNLLSSPDDLYLLPDVTFEKYYYRPGRYIILEHNDLKYSLPVCIADIIFEEQMQISKHDIKKVVDSFRHDVTISIIYKETLYIVPGTYGVISFCIPNNIVKRIFIPNVSALSQIEKRVKYSFKNTKNGNFYMFSNINPNKYSMYNIVTQCLSKF